MRIRVRWADALGMLGLCVAAGLVVTVLFWG